MRELVRLRHRFILILMFSVGLVLTIALVVSVVSNFTTQYNRIQSSLAAAQAIGRAGELRPNIGGRGSSDLADTSGGQTETLITLSEDAPPMITTEIVPVYAVEIAGGSDAVTAYGAAARMDASTLNEALSRIQSSNSTSGLFLDLGLFYSQQVLADGAQRIVFADASQLFNTTLQQALIALLIWVVAMVAFFVLSRILSRMALKPVEEAWDRQRQFIADASHELRTPLTIILANNNVIQSHPEKTTAEQQQWLESTGEEANRMNDMVTDLLLLAQIENATGASKKAHPDADDDILPHAQAGEPESSAGSGGPESNMGSAGKPGGKSGGRITSSPTRSVQSSILSTSSETAFTSVDLSSLVDRTLLQFDAVFFERGMTSKAEIEEGLHTTGNQAHLRRLIAILLDNASKYGDKGGVVEVRLARSAEKHHSALLTVQNSGPLIPADKIGRIYERFYRVDDAHSSMVEGSGLGLALAHEIVREHGGSISASSVPTSVDPASADTASFDVAETTFSVLLPLA